MPLKRVVITGLGAITPIGNTIPEFWEALQNGVSGATDITKFDATHFKTRFACEVKNFDGVAYLGRKEARKMDLFSQYAIAASDQAIEDAGLKTAQLNYNKIGVIWASGIGGLNSFQAQIADYLEKGQDKPFRFSPFFIPKMIIDMAPGLISIRHGFKGVNFSVVSACASSTHALIDAYHYIQLGKADAIIAGGSEAPILESSIGGFSATKALSQRNDSPKTASRPFDLNRDGFVMGEGGGALVLESYEHAMKRGAKIYAELLGSGTSADAYHITAPHPEGEGAARVMEEALEDAGITPDLIDYINVHGTSTPLGDPQELKAIQKVFGDHAYQLNISSSKSMIGHLLGAAGAVEAIATLLAIHHNIVPPTINHFDDDPNIDPRFRLTFHKAQKRQVNYAISNNFGFGGHNASVLFGKIE